MKRKKSRPHFRLAEVESEKRFSNELPQSITKNDWDESIVFVIIIIIITTFTKNEICSPGKGCKLKRNKHPWNIFAVLLILNE